MFYSIQEPYLQMETMSAIDLMRKIDAPLTVSAKQTIEAIITQGADIDLAALGVKPVLQKEKSRALITIDGPIAYNASIVDKVIFGAVDSKDILQACMDVMQDNSIKDVVLAVNSPGGNAYKLHQVADAVYQMSRVKNTASVNVGMMASAGYRIGSQANNVFVDDQYNMTGSIGTKTVLYDHSEQSKMMGIEVITVDTGPFKSFGQLGTKITEEHVEMVKDRINEMQSVFNMEVERTRVNADMSDGSEGRSGKVFSFQKAQELGLVDGLKSVNEAFDFLSMGRRVSKLKQSI
jgi:protease-4